MVHDCNPSTRETEAAGSQVQDQPGIHSETMSQNKIKQKEWESLIISFNVFAFLQNCHHFFLTL
jgi:hypothetical protein